MSGRLYEESDDGGFVLTNQVNASDPDAVGLRLRTNYRPLQLVLEHGVYLYDRSVEGVSTKLEKRLGGLESAALLVESDPRRILAFGLRTGWERDHLDFALNTIRNAINHRLNVQDMAMDFEQAAEIQRSLLPTGPPEFGGYKVAARSIAAARVGGDFYDYVRVEAETLTFAVGDASGHGLGAALLARDVVTGLRMGSERALKITEIVTRLNRVIARSMLSTRFVSLIYGELEGNGNVFYVNAGHPAPWIVGPRGVRRLAIGGTILGPLPERSYQRGWAHVDHGDTMLVITDGIIERANLDGEMFGDEGVERVLQETLGQPASVILKTLLDATAAHGGNRAWMDDTTALVITRDP
jgi:serine phosphatase RsbU (regulator of sigma subunit)